ncbi:MAG: filamentous hemagglutinin N-terminal domain-containing protein, partial [Candidatus Omnitrophica bacterium]|nr:filamentous hemagglutinin N-terminal domain-containing protein [Candidatus Omnitrophota bacterium]
MFRNRNVILDRIVALLVILTFMCYPNISFALPQGGVVVDGSATIDDSIANTLNINQETEKMIAEWQSFSIGQPETVNFYQPGASSVALNRVVGINPSQIFGALNANGQVFLVNASGIVFSPTATVDVNGLVASTLDISNADFMNGNYFFQGLGGSVINQGRLSAPGGYVALLGSSVKNTGLISADLGSVVLASGEAITLGLDAQNMITVVVDAATTQSLSGAEAVLNAGTISAKGGKVILSAKALNGVFDNAINNIGVIEAGSLNSVNGQVVLEANQRVNVAGQINAQGGTVIVNSEGADYSGIINAADGYYNANGGDTYITGGTYSGNQIWQDDLNVFLSGNITVNSGNVTIHADKNDLDSLFTGYVSISGNLLLTSGNASIEGASVYLNTGSSVKANSGNIQLTAENLSVATLAELFINGVVIAENGNVGASSTGDVKHGTNGDVFVKNGDFTGSAGRDYIMEDGSSIIVQEGVINIEALRDIILGVPGQLASGLDWKYVSGDRGYKLVEIGYYYVDTNGDVIEVPFPGASLRTDIGKDGGQNLGAATITNATDLGFYVVMYNGATPVGTFYTNAALNADLKDHVSIDPNGKITVSWEDQFNLGDRDYNDVVISYAPVGDGELLLGVHLYSIMGSGTAHVGLDAGQDINANRAHINALVDGEGHAEVVMNADRDILMANSTILAEVGSGTNSAIITADALGSIRHTDTIVRAVNNSEGNAHIIYDAVNEIELDRSLLKTETYAGGTEDWDSIAAVVSLETVLGDVILKGSGSDVIAQVNNSGKALAQIDAGEDAIINHSRVKALVGGEGSSKVDVDAKADISVVNNSDVLAQVGSGEISAVVEFDAGYDIEVTDSTIEAIGDDDSNDTNTVTIDMDAGDDIRITRSTLRAEAAQNGTALVKMNARDVGSEGDIEITGGTILSKVGHDGDADVVLDADNDIIIDPSTVSAIVDEDGDATVTAVAGRDIKVI